MAARGDRLIFDFSIFAWWRRVRAAWSRSRDMRGRGCGRQEGLTPGESRGNGAAPFTVALLTARERPEGVPHPALRNCRSVGRERRAGACYAFRCAWRA